MVSVKFAEDSPNSSKSVIAGLKTGIIKMCDTLSCPNNCKKPWVRIRFLTSAKFLEAQAVAGCCTHLQKLVQKNLPT